jgi:hypothetical protein
VAQEVAAENVVYAAVEAQVAQPTIRRIMGTDVIILENGQNLQSLSTYLRSNSRHWEANLTRIIEHSFVDIELGNGFR